jgi:hypothetical protein
MLRLPDLLIRCCLLCSEIPRDPNVASLQRTGGVGGDRVPRYATSVWSHVALTRLCLALLLLALPSFSPFLAPLSLTVFDCDGRPRFPRAGEAAGVGLLGVLSAPRACHAALFSRVPIFSPQPLRVTPSVHVFCLDDTTAADFPFVSQKR